VSGDNRKAEEAIAIRMTDSFETQFDVAIKLAGGGSITRTVRVTDRNVDLGDLMRRIIDGEFDVTGPGVRGCGEIVYRNDGRAWLVGRWRTTDEDDQLDGEVSIDFLSEAGDLWTFDAVEQLEGVQVTATHPLLHMIGADQAGLKLAADQKPRVPVAGDPPRGRKPGVATKRASAAGEGKRKSNR
jgi:hypothetical protein